VLEGVLCGCVAVSRRGAEVHRRVDGRGMKKKMMKKKRRDRGERKREGEGR